MSVLAITGGTGFVGGRLIELALHERHQVRALTRRPQPNRDGLTWVPGALDDAAALAELVNSADAVIHVAGIVNAPDRAGFVAGNVTGTANMLAAAEAAGAQRFVHVSSLAAREPGLSMYGWSKAEAEKLVAASPLSTAIIRPPAIYGPGDYEMLDLFKIAAKGFALTPPAGRLSVIEVGDLGRLLLALATAEITGSFDADDGGSGWTHADFSRAIGDALGKRVKVFALPRPLLSLAARIDGLVRGKKAKLTQDRVAYFCHPDWTIEQDRRPPTQLWQPDVPTPSGLYVTAKWYRDNGLL